MMRYFGRRLLRTAILLLAVSAISFCLFELAPGDYFDNLRMDPAVSPDTIQALRKQHGLDQHVALRYIRWLTSVIRGEWGFSVAYNSPAGPLLFGRARNTLILTSSAVLLTWLMAVPFALWTASGGNRRRLLANAVVAVLLSLPEILVLLIFMAIAAHWGILPAGGMTSLGFSRVTLWSKALDLILHLAVPVAALVLAALPALILHTRTALVEALNTPFVRFARANGIPRRRLLIRHALPAASNPMITLLGLSVGTLLSSGILVEAISGWPGLGHLLLQALLQRDLPVVSGAVLLSSVFLVTGNLLADILLYATDPRIREGP
jgi:peptide/nickel transport system permease protein